MEEARNALEQAIYGMDLTASLDAECVRAAEVAMHEAAKYDTHCEALAARVEVAKRRVRQARAAEAERARVAAEAAEAAAAAAAVERLQLEQEAAALASRMQSDAMRLQQMHAQLGVVPPAVPAPQPAAEEAMCVVCMDAPKQHIILPCFHWCVCEACAQQLTQTRHPSCPMCRNAIHETRQVY